MFRVKSDKQAFFVGPDIEPVMNVPDGATVIFETTDCFRGVVENPEDCFSSYGECLQVMDVPCMNPVTGPIAIQGASPGDFLAIEILDIKLPEKGATSYIPNLGMFMLSREMGKSHVWRWR
jgi:amidase